MSAEQASSVPATPGDATPSLSNQVSAVDFFIKMTMEMQRQLGAMQTKVEGLEKTNIDLQQRLAESNKHQEQLTSELNEAKQQVAKLKLELQESVTSIQQLKAEDQKLASQVDGVKINTQREQEQARADTQALKQQIEQVARAANESKDTAAKIAATEQGLFAESVRNNARLDRLQQAFASVDGLVVGTKQELSHALGTDGSIVPTAGNPAMTRIAIATGRAVYKPLNVYLSSETQVAFKAMGEALKVEETPANDKAAPKPAVK